MWLCLIQSACVRLFVCVCVCLCLFVIVCVCMCAFVSGCMCLHDCYVYVSRFVYACACLVV